MQVGRINGTDVTANAVKTTCIKKPCKNNLQSQPMNDTFVSSKGKNISFGGTYGALLGGAFGGGSMALLALSAATGPAAPLVFLGAWVVGAAGGATLGNAATGKDKD